MILGKNTPFLNEPKNAAYKGIFIFVRGSPSSPNPFSFNLVTYQNCSTEGAEMQTRDKRQLMRLRPLWL